ncbi:hypothetical protein EV189_3402 [Motilibacter rhizosphaerae]|uniref:DUF456 domain-containing protein n=1 Tax=Motilibacter rhizosphaerae TaxID=598652 RepID=A0A4Q7NGT3_9ACTN|nr:DUF456 domain-containing protein [Motilibacter rhizosphaerae]RZS83004.1 hypothetical protein EV189_3402 [Motilibacter rhizosphaerae]
MGTNGLVLTGVLLVIGVAGVLIPVVPGSLLVAVTAAVWAWQEHRAGAWVAFVLMLVLLAAGTVGKYAVPGRAVAGTGAPRSTVVVGAVCAVAGFFLVPFVGVPLGFVVGVFVAELARLRAARAAWRTTWSTLTGIGLGMLVELGAASLALTVWVAAVLVLHA